MAAEDQTEPVAAAQHKVVRRGLLTGLAGLGAAALLKVTGAGKAERAEAATASLQFPTTTGSATINTEFSQTNLNLDPTVVATMGIVALVVDAGGGPTTSYRDGIHGTAGGTGGYGVQGFGSGGASNGGYGVLAMGGLSTSTGGSVGVYSIGGTTSASNLPGGAGVVGVGGSATAPATRAGDGVQGTSTNGKGVYGSSTSNDGVHGNSGSGVGLRGTSSSFVGMVGISDTSIGLYGYNVSPNVPAFYAENLGPNNRIAGLFTGDVQVHGNFTVTGGAKSAAVTMPDGSEALVYCQEAPEPYFEDFGRSQLSNGAAHVTVDPEFASIVRPENYMVFPVAEGNCNGLCVVNRAAGGFDVREVNGGTSNVPFSYRIVARRKDIEGKRLARVDPAVKNNIAKMRADAAQHGPGAAGATAGETPLVPNPPLPPSPPQPQPHGNRGGFGNPVPFTPPAPTGGSGVAPQGNTPVVTPQNNPPAGPGGASSPTSGPS